VKIASHLRREDHCEMIMTAAAIAGWDLMLWFLA
jgi:hypothetical protein